MNINTKTLAIGFLAFIGVLIITSALVNWYRPPTTPPKEFAKAEPIPELAKVPKVTIAVPKVQVYDKPAATKKIPDLPKEITDNVDVEITASATPGPTKAGYNVVSVINKNSGESSIYYREKERSLIEFLNEKRIGVAYGITTDNGQQFVKVFGEWTVLRVGSVHVGMQADIKSKQSGTAEGTAVAVVDYRW